MVEKILATAAGLATFPKLGRVVPELDQPEIRERFVYSYRLIYQIETERVLLIAVVHGKRLVGDVVSRPKVKNRRQTL